MSTVENTIWKVFEDSKDVNRMETIEALLTRDPQYVAKVQFTKEQASKGIMHEQGLARSLLKSLLFSILKN